MSQLKSNHQVICSIEAPCMCRYQCFPQFCQTVPGSSVDDKLIGICATIRSNGHGFSAKDQFRAALPKTLPAPKDFLCDQTVSGGIPAFHRLNGISVSNLLPVNDDM